MIWEGFWEGVCEEISVHIVLMGKEGLTSVTWEQQCGVYGIWGFGYGVSERQMKSEPTLGESTPMCSNHLWCYMGRRPLTGRAEGWEGPSGLPHRGTALSGQCKSFAVCEGCDLWVRS